MKIGQRATDVTNNKFGVLLSRLESIDAGDRLSLQIEDSDKCEFIDTPFLKVTSEELVFEVTEPPAEAFSSITLGDEVQDTITDFRGIATHRMTYANGCVFIGVTPKVSERHPNPETVYFGWQRIKVLKPLKTPPLSQRTRGPKIDAAVRRG